MLISSYFVLFFKLKLKWTWLKVFIIIIGLQLKKGLSFIVYFCYKIYLYFISVFVLRLIIINLLIINYNVYSIIIKIKCIKNFSLIKFICFYYKLKGPMKKKIYQLYLKAIDNSFELLKKKKRNSWKNNYIQLYAF